MSAHCFIFLLLFLSYFPFHWIRCAAVCCLSTNLRLSTVHCRAVNVNVVGAAGALSKSRRHRHRADLPFCFAAVLLSLVPLSLTLSVSLPSCRWFGYLETNCANNYSLTVDDIVLQVRPMYWVECIACLRRRHNSATYQRDETRDPYKQGRKHKHILHGHLIYTPFTR